MNNDNEAHIPGKLSRRQLLTTVGAVCVGLLNPRALAKGSSDYVRKANAPLVRGKILSKAQMHILRELVEVIIPATDTLGAAATDTHGYIDDQLAYCKSPAEARLFIQQLDRVSKLSKAHWGREYWDQDVATKGKIMTQIAEGAAPFDELSARFFTQLKALCIIGYYSSEEGASKELIYLPVPGGYKGSYKLSENNGRAFSPFYF